MWKKAKRFLAVLLALTLMLSVVDSEELFVSASATDVQEDTGAGGETEPAAGEETKSTDVSVEEDTAVTSVGDEGSGEVTATVPGDGTGTGTETGGAADATGTDGTETAGTGTETSGSGTEGAEGTTVPGSETPANGTEGTEGAAGTGDTTAGESGETEGDVTDGTTEAADDGTDGTTTAPGTETDGNGSEETGTETETGENGTVGTEQSDVVTGETGNGETEDAEGKTDTAEDAEDTEDTAETTYMAETAHDGQTVKVFVEVPEDAFDGDITPVLHADAVTDEEELDKAAAAVEEQTETVFDGMIALDVYFTDGDTEEEIEPAVPVSVRFELSENALPENIDASTLTVHHLAENRDASVTVETIATATTSDDVDGVVALSDVVAEKAEVSEDVALLSELDDVADTVENGIENPAVVAEFDVKSFSTFTITWTQDKLIGQDEIERIKFTIVDTDGNELNVSDSYNLSYRLTYNKRISFEEIVAENGIQTILINGEEYTFRNATLIINNGERHPVSSVEWIEDGWDVGSVANNDKVRFYDSVFSGETGVYTRDNEGNAGDSLELIYRRSDESSTEVYEPEPTYSKAAVTNDDGKTYDLALTVSGSVGTATENQKVDVLFIVDQSGSMAAQMYYPKIQRNQSYQYIVADQARTLATALANNTNLDARFAVVTFSDSIAGTQYYNDGIMRLSWTNDASQVFDAANQHSYGGTNYEAGLLSGRAAIIESRPDAVKYVVFLSDGQPTFHYTDNGEQTGGGDDTQPDDIGNAVEEAGNYDFVNGFFTIRVGNESSADTHLDSVRNAVREAVGASVDNENFGGFTATDSDDLVESFEKIQAQITSLSMTDVMIEDVLTQYVKAAVGAEPYLLVKHTVDGEIVTDRYDAEKVGNVIKEISYDSATKTLKCEFMDTYSLLPGYTYELHLEIVPTEKAFTEYASTGYPLGMIGEPDTGTFAGENGFYSNVDGKAMLTYTTPINSHSVEYPMPVVQVPSTSLIIEKDFEGLKTSEEKAAAANLITFTVRDGSTVVKNNIVLHLNSDGTYSAEVTGLTAGKTYVVEENYSAPEGYNVTTNTPSQTTSPLSSTVDNILSFTNKYTPAEADLEICKQIVIEGDEDADLSVFDGKEFTFIIQGTNSENTDIVKEVMIRTDENGVGSATVEDLPLGSYNVSEKTDESDFPDEVGDYGYVSNDGPRSTTVAASGGFVDIVNVYKHQDKVLTVGKEVKGNLGNTSEKFNFTLTIKKTSSAVSEEITEDEYVKIAATAKRFTGNVEDDGFYLSFNGETAAFTLSDNQKMTIEIPHGYYCMVNETRGDYTAQITVDDTSWSNESNASGSITKDTNVTVINSLDTGVPTGLNQNNTPFVLMTAIAAVTGLVLLGGFFVYHISRRRDR